MNTLKRPDCFEFAMDFLGGEEAAAIRKYIEDLETNDRRWRFVLEQAPDTVAIITYGASREVCAHETAVGAVDAAIQQTGFK